MTFDISSLKKEEKVALKLRQAYEGFGYRKYNMSRFEEYAFYMEYKSFLAHDRIISFTDTDGNLRALKPDVTLSIVKNAKEIKGRIEKLYYIENVYKPDKNSNKFKEISQIGLEAMGTIDEYTTIEVINLAIKSLEELEDDYVLDLSHMGIVMGLLNIDELEDCELKDKILECIVSKNLHDLRKALGNGNISKEISDRFEKLITIQGTLGESLEEIKSIVINKETQNAYLELLSIYNALKGTANESKVKVDFSIINDVNYYCGIIFQGYVKKVPHNILSGGRYDKLLHKLGKGVGAIGFALTLDELQLFYPEDKSLDADIVVVYDKESSTKELYQAIEDLTSKGLKVKAERTIPTDIKYGKICKFSLGKMEDMNV